MDPAIFTSPIPATIEFEKYRTELSRRLPATEVFPSRETAAWRQKQDWRVRGLLRLTLPASSIFPMAIASVGYPRESSRPLRARLSGVDIIPMAQRRRWHFRRPLACSSIRREI